MLDVANLLIYGAAVSAISFFAIMLLMPVAIKSLAAKGRAVPDAHKRERPMIPRPAGPVIMAGIAVAEIVLYLLTMNAAVLAVPPLPPWPPKPSQPFLPPSPPARIRRKPALA